MKPLLLILISILWTIRSESQIMNHDSSSLSNNLTQFNRFIEESCSEFENSYNFDSINILGHRIRQFISVLKEEIRSYYKCENADMGENLALAVAMDAVCLGCGTPYLLEAFTDEKCPPLRIRYTSILEDMYYWGRKLKSANDLLKAQEYKEELLELNEKLSLTLRES